MLKSIALASASLVAVSTPAMAQDQGQYSGFRAEALIGYDRVALDLDTTYEAENDLEYDGQHSSGAFYGVGVGYDYTVAGFRFGIDAELNDSTVSEGYAFSGTTFDGELLDSTIDLNAGRDIYVGGRVGAAYSSTAYYVKAGYSMARFSATERGTLDGQSYVTDGILDVEGLRLGAGIEQQFGRNAFVKLEYRYTNYGEAKLRSEGQEVDVDEAFDVIDFDRHQGVVGLGYRF
jgi:outer membrane immunogenic protein